MRGWRQYLTSDKEYNGVIRFGVTTDSDDITGYVHTRVPTQQGIITITKLVDV